MGVIYFMIKTLIVLTALIALRAIYPRYRLDQALRIGWKPLLGMSILALLLSLLEVIL